jgi:hypothetical protein
MIEGGCPCETIRYEYDGVPIISYKCHCRDCQKYSSAGYQALFWAWARSFKFVSGSPAWRTHTGTSGREVSRGFCKDCGASVVARLEVLPQIIGVPASSLDDVSIFQPEYETWVSSALSWDLLDSRLPQLDGNFTAEIIQARLYRRDDA